MRDGFHEQYKKHRYNEIQKCLQVQGGDDYSYLIRVLAWHCLQRTEQNRVGWG